MQRTAMLPGKLRPAGQIAVCVGLLTQLSLLIQPAAALDVLLFSHFLGERDGARLAWSLDGRHFNDLGPYVGGSGGGGGRIFVYPILRPPSDWGDQRLIRDPSIAYHDGLFHMVWTTDWSGNIFGYASSTDLVTWSTPKQVQPFSSDVVQPENVWAPEVFWDHIAENYKIAWSSTIPGTYVGDRIYYTSTDDFQTFEAPELLLKDEGFRTIDGHVIWLPDEEGAGGRWAMSFKNEDHPDDGGKNIHLAFSDPAISPSSFTDDSGPIVGVGSAVHNGANDLAEGPSMVNWNGEWLLYWDPYINSYRNGYAMASSTDLVNWTDETSSLSFLTHSHVRHGTAFVADADIIGFRLPYPEDLNADGVLDVKDWDILRSHYQTDLSPYAAMGQSLRGDIDGDGDNDADDQRLFATTYDRRNGDGAFAELLVPERCTATLTVLSIALGSRARRRRCQ